MKKIKESLFAVCFILVAALLLQGTGDALRPVRRSFGCEWSDYLAEPYDSLDYLYLGSSYGYCDVSPGIIYGESGLTGYALCGPVQTLSITAAYLEEALKTQSPKRVFVETSGLQFEKYGGYSQANIDYMPNSIQRLKATFTAAEPELRTGLLFPLYFYHDRWKSVNFEEMVRSSVPLEKCGYKGYTGMYGAYGAADLGPQVRLPAKQAQYAENLQELGIIAKICQKNNIPLTVVIHPTYCRLPEETRLQMRNDVLSLGSGVSFYDWTTGLSAMGINENYHFYDAAHLNRDGAKIFSRWLGRLMTEDLGMVPQDQSAKNEKDWIEASKRALE